MAFENKLKKKLLAREPAIGCWLSTGSPMAAEIVANAGYDAVVIDHEHGPGDFLNAISLMQACGEVGTPTMMRVPWNDMVYIKRALDIGMQGILVPYVQTAKEAKAAVDACHYPVKGLRGVAPHAGRCSRWGQRLDEYMASWPEQLLLMVQIETAEAVENIEEIAAVDGVDGVFIGPADLHASLGYLGERAHADVMPRIDDAIRRIVKAGKAPGILTDSEENARRWIALGALFVAVGADVGLLARAADALAAKFRN